jgi:pilus assembly protein FimV
VAEADVYMAYGRDAQAEEILIDALKVDPSRGAVYVKLLEIYAHRKSLKQFESLAADFYTLTGGKGPDWQKAAAIGRKLDPGNPLYGAADGAQGASDGLGLAGGAALAGMAAGAAAAATTPAPAASLEFGGAPESAVSMKDTWALPGELSQLTESMDQAVDMDLTASLPAIPAVQETASESLDFDLDLGEPQSSPERPAMPMMEDSSGLDFNLDVGPDTVPAEELKPARGAAAKQQATAGAMMADDIFALESDGTPPAGAMDFGLPGKAAANDPMVDLSATVIADSGKHPGYGGDEDLERTSLSADLLNFDLDLDEAGPARAPAVDLSGIDLDLDAMAQATTLEPLDLGMGDDLGGASGEADGGEEVETKLELARAYEEMGDRDGAKELLEEVLKEGSTAQQNAARTLLGRLG